jgi:peptide chain release factor 3
VLKVRLEEEYGARCRFEPAAIHQARWVSGEAGDLGIFKSEHAFDLAQDKKGNLVYLCPNEFRLQTVEKNFPSLRFDKFHIA